MNHQEEDINKCDFCSKYCPRTETTRRYDSYYCDDCKYWTVFGTASYMKYHIFYFVHEKRIFYVEHHLFNNKVQINVLDNEYDFHEDWKWVDSKPLSYQTIESFVAEIHPKKLNRILMLMNFS